MPFCCSTPPIVCKKRILAGGWLLRSLKSFPKPSLGWILNRPTTKIHQCCAKWNIVLLCYVTYKNNTGKWVTFFLQTADSPLYWVKFVWKRLIFRKTDSLQGDNFVFGEWHFFKCVLKDIFDRINKEFLNSASELLKKRVVLRLEISKNLIRNIQNQRIFKFQKLEAASSKLHKIQWFQQIKPFFITRKSDTMMILLTFSAIF